MTHPPPAEPATPAAEPTAPPLGPTAPTAPVASALPGYPLPSYPPSGPGQPGHPYDVYGPERRRTNGLAIASMVLGLLGLMMVPLILSIIFGLVALAQIRRWAQPGRGFAIAGLVLSAGWIAVFVTIFVVNPGERDPGPVERPDRVSISQVRVGDCVNDLVEGRVVRAVNLVPCESAHQAEVYVKFSLPAGPFPGLDEASRQAENGCVTRLEQYAPDAVDDTGIGVFFTFPSDSRQWRADPSVLCFALYNTPRTGSILG